MKYSTCEIIQKQNCVHFATYEISPRSKTRNLRARTTTANRTTDGMDPEIKNIQNNICIQDANAYAQPVTKQLRIVLPPPDSRRPYLVTLLPKLYN